MSDEQRKSSYFETSGYIEIRRFSRTFCTLEPLQYLGDGYNMVGILIRSFPITT